MCISKINIHMAILLRMSKYTKFLPHTTKKITLKLTLQAYCAEYGAALPPWQWSFYNYEFWIYHQISQILETILLPFFSRFKNNFLKEN